jgi:hypothetical protein
MGDMDEDVGKKAMRNDKRRFKSSAFEAIHESAAALHKVGAIDNAAMQEFDGAALHASPTHAAKLPSGALGSFLDGCKAKHGELTPDELARATKELTLTRRDKSELK